MKDNSGIREDIMKNSKQPLAGRVTLVTGAGGGIGRAISSRFASLGSRVYLCDVRDSGSIAEEINDQYKVKLAEPATCDISSDCQVLKMFRNIEEKDKGIDILVNNAAIQGPNGPTHFPDITLDGFRKTFDIDLSGAVYCILNALPHMKKQRWGRIIFTAAPLSSSGIPSPYLAGKAGFTGLAKHIAQKYHQFNISTFALALRHVDTPMIRRVISSRHMNVEEGIKKMHEKSLTGRMITPGEIADLYALFATAPERSIGGLTLLADGGITYLR